MERRANNSDDGDRLRPTVLVANTTWWPTAARVALSLTDVGFTVAAICASGHPIAKTRKVKQIFRYDPLRPLTSLLQAIEECNPALIIPCDDRATEHLHDLFQYAEQHGPAYTHVIDLIKKSLGKSASYPVVSDRFQLLDFAAREGIRVPETHLVRTFDDLERSRPTFPGLLKASGTWGGHGVRISRSLAEAHRTFDAMMRPLTLLQATKRYLVNRDPFWFHPWHRGGCPTLIWQQFIAGRAGNFAGLAWNGKILAGVTVEAVETQGQTGPAIAVRIVRNDEMLHAAERLANRLGISGYFGLDFVLEEGSGNAYLIEMNPRCTQPCHLDLGEGRYPAGALWSTLTSTLTEAHPQPGSHPVASDVITYFPQAWHWDHQSPLLRTGYHDVPWQERELVRELLRLPHPDRGWMAQLSNRLRRLTYEERTRRARSGAIEGQIEAPRETPRSDSFDITFELGAD